MKDNQSQEKNTTDMGREKSILGGSIKKKRGIYTAAISAIVIAIVIVFNLLVGSLPDGTLEFDISDQDLYEITQQSVDFIGTLEKDVSIIVLAQDAAIDDMLSKFINNYAKLSSHITLKIIDPVINPTVLETYGAQENNIVVTCTDTGKSRVLNLGGIYGYEDGLILYDAQTVYYYGQYQPVAIDAEGQLTSAINYVTSDVMHKLYLLEGHGESTLGTIASEAISKSNTETSSLNLLKSGSIPEDCELIISYNPTEDLVSDELDMLENYLKTGGNVMLLMDNTDLENYNTLLQTYGFEIQDGYVGDYDNVYSTFYNDFGYFCFYPELSTSSSITALIEQDAIILASHGLLEVTPLRRGATVTAFMTTSDNAYLDIDPESTGQFILGATSVETFEETDDTESRLTVITAIDLISDEIPTSYSNMDIFISAVNANFDDVQSIVIPSKSLELEMIQISHLGVWSTLFIGIIPLTFIIGGLVYWIKRRNR